MRKELATALAAQKEASERLSEVEDLRRQLKAALAENHESTSKLAEFR